VLKTGQPNEDGCPVDSSSPEVLLSARRFDWDRAIAILLISPSILAIAIFVYAFIAWTGWASLLRWNDLLPLQGLPPFPQLKIYPPQAPFVQLENYIRLIASDERFRQDLENTVTFTVLFIGACLALGLLLAVLLDQKIRGEGLFRGIYLFPMSVSFIVTGVVWRWVLTPGTEQSGAVGVNLLLEKMGLGFLKNGWYTDPNIGIKAVVIAAAWQMAGYTMALYLAGLRGIPEDLREAARVDGATEWQAFRHVILPLLQPVTLSAVIILGHISLKIFDLISSMTGPGAGFSTDVPAYYLFDTVFRGNHFARGAAIAIILLLMVSVLVVPYLIYNARTEVER
jgi:glucose/mannose transport system permease protein